MNSAGGTDQSHRAAPYLPPSTPPQPAPRAAAEDAPYLPAATPPVPTPAPEPEFDAAAMVASQKHFNANPTYGEMPSGSAAGRDAARLLREQANRRRRRARVLGRLVMLLVLVGLGVGGYFVYQLVRDAQDDGTVEETEAGDDAATAEDATADSDTPAALTPLGEQAEVIAGQEILNDAARPGGSGLLDAIDDARDVVGDVNSDVAADPAAPADGPTAAVEPIVEGDVLPLVLESVSEQLPTEDGFERYVIDATAFESANVGAYGRFVAVAAAQPRTDSPAFALLPELGPTEIGLAVQRVDGELSRVVIVTADRSLAVDVTL